MLSMLLHCVSLSVCLSIYISAVTMLGCHTYNALTNKVRRIRNNISAALQQSTHRLFATRPHIGPQLSVFQPVTIDEVRKLLTSMPCKTSHSLLDVLPCSLLKDCADVFAPVITRLANMSLQAGTVQVGPSAATSEEGRAR